MALASVLPTDADTDPGDFVKTAHIRGLRDGVLEVAANVWNGTNYELGRLYVGPTDPSTLTPAPTTLYVWINTA